MNGQWRDTIGVLDFSEDGDRLFGHQIDEKCGLRQDWHPWPSRDAPVLQKLATLGEFRVCAVGDSSFGPIGLDTTTPEPTGEIVDYVSHVVEQMSIGLGSALDLVWEYGVDENECLAKLDAGTVHMFGPVDGVGDKDHDGAELLRAFEPACAIWAVSNQTH